MNAKHLEKLVNTIIAGLDPDDFDEPINWGDLKCTEAVLPVDGVWEITIDEAAPECQEFCSTIESELYRLGIDAVVRTEW